MELLTNREKFERLASWFRFLQYYYTEVLAYYVSLTRNFHQEKFYFTHIFQHEIFFFNLGKS